MILCMDWMCFTFSLVDITVVKKDKLLTAITGQLVKKETIDDRKVLPTAAAKEPSVDIVTTGTDDSEAIEGKCDPLRTTLKRKELYPFIVVGLSTQHTLHRIVKEI